MHRVAASWLVLGAFAAGCPADPPSNPFVTTSTAAGGGGTGGGGGGSSVDPELGEPCVEGAQCDDEIACTVDSCDPAYDRCRHHPEPATCDNGVHCDGAEICDGSVGCIPGPPVDCGDGDLCTIDTCVEASQSCRHDPRDADADGDPDAHCPGGGDCDDFDPTISSLTQEVCDNTLDDDCDSETDEAECASPENDTCADALLVEGTSTFTLSTFGAIADYATSCSPGGIERDVVAAIVVPPGPPVDIVARARTDSAPVSMAITGQCGDPASEIACGPSSVRAGFGMVSRLRARSIGGGGAATAFPLYVTTDGGSEVTMDVTFAPATTAPTHETCASALDLSLGASTEVEIVDATEDLETACAHTLGELVYRIQLDETSDLDVWGVSVDGDGQVALSLRDAECALAEDELACHTSSSAHVFRHSLEPGEYFLSVSATAPTTVNLLAELSPPTPPPPDEDCDAATPIEPNVTRAVVFDEHQDDHQLGCFQSAVDAAYSLTVEAPSDVLLVQRISTLDSAGIALSDPGCTADDVLVCSIGAKSPNRARRRNVQPGDYRVVAESALGMPQEVTAFVRPYSPSTLVVFADDCDDALTIPASGGFFQGNTSNVTASFSAGCDSSGGQPNGAKDQLLKLVLTQPRRVIFDMSGSGYETLLDVRRGPSCPGTEVPLGCSASVSGGASYLDLDLEAGTYFVQIDGRAGATGPWMLDVHVVDP